jgi:hypothetical protein
MISSQENSRIEESSKGHGTLYTPLSSSRSQNINLKNVSLLATQNHNMHTAAIVSV